ncbi:hypothetical protein Tco_1111000 [Tanacetum coccineum]|uniref:Uncharacterized protein n=1 Tax=Tanacetum coccineum TaxID=301880 RepID=A0ABQ5IMQ6_9ASTR
MFTTRGDAKSMGHPSVPQWVHCDKLLSMSKVLAPEKSQVQVYRAQPKGLSEMIVHSPLPLEFCEYKKFRANLLYIGEFPRDGSLWTRALRSSAFPHLLTRKYFTGEYKGLPGRSLRSNQQKSTRSQLEIGNLSTPIERTKRRDLIAAEQIKASENVNARNRSLTTVCNVSNPVIHWNFMKSARVFPSLLWSLLLKDDREQFSFKGVNLANSLRIEAWTVIGASVLAGSASLSLSARVMINAFRSLDLALVTHTLVDVSHGNVAVSGWDIQATSAETALGGKSCVLILATTALFLNCSRADNRMLVPLCFAIFDLEPLSLSFDFVFTSEISKYLSFSLNRLCLLAILCLDQHAHTLHLFESLLTVSLDNYCLDNLDVLKEDLEYQSLRKSLSFNS